MGLKELWYILCLTLVFVSSSFSQERSLSGISHLSVPDGLTDRSVLKVVGDSLGFYFIHTPLAIQKYYKGEFIETLPISTKGQKVPFELYRGVIYLLDENDCLNMIDPSQLSVESQFCLEEISKSSIQMIELTSEGAVLLTEESENNYKLSFSNYNNEVLRFDKIQYFKTDQEINAIIYMKGEDAFYIIVNHRQLYRIGSTTTLHHIGCDDHLSTSRSSKLISHDNSNELFYSFGRCSGVFKLDALGNRDTISQSGGLQFVEQDRLSNVLIGVTNERVLHLDELIFVSKNGHTEVWNEILKINNRIARVTSENFEDNIIASTYNGVFYYDFLSDGIELFLHDSNLAEGEFGNVVRGFCLGADEGIVMVKEGGEIIHKMTEDSIYIDDVLSSYFGYGTVWVDYNKSDNSTAVLQYHRDGRSDLHMFKNRVRQRIYPLDFTAEKFHIDIESIWITGRKNEKGIVAKIDQTSGEVEFKFTQELQNTHVRASYFGEDYYLFGTYDGILIYSIEDENLVKLGELKNFDNPVSYIGRFEDLFAVGTYGKGVYLFDERFKLVSHTNVGNSIPSNTVASIQKDQYWNYWISTFSGIVVLDSLFNTIDHLNLSNERNPGEYNRSASFQDENGLLYFGSINGLVRIDPEEYFNQKGARHLVLEGMTASKDEMEFFLSGNEESHRFTLNPDILKLKLIDPGFYAINSIDLLAQHRLHFEPPVDSIYIENGVVYATGFDFQSYSLIANHRVNRSPEYTVSKFTIERDLSQIFKNILTAILIAGALSLLMYINFRRWKRKTSERLRLENELSEVRLKALRSQLNPHFVFNALNSIQYYIQTSDKKMARSYLNKFAKLIRLILESSHYDYVSIRKELDQLRLYMQLEKLRFEDKWDFELNYSDRIIQTSPKIPSMVIQPIIENAIIHGVSHLKAKKGRVQVDFDLIDDFVVVIVQDNGIGRKASEQLNREKKSKHPSLSTSISQARLALLNSSSPNNYEISYLDLRDVISKETGTRVTIKMKPMRHEAA